MTCRCPVSRLVIAAAWLANVVMLIAAGCLAANAYGNEVYAALLLAVPPLLSMIALYSGPDREERSLTRSVAKARLKKELEDYEAGKKSR